MWLIGVGLNISQFEVMDFGFWILGGFVSSILFLCDSCKAGSVVCLNRLGLCICVVVLQW